MNAKEMKHWVQLWLDESREIHPSNLRSHSIDVMEGILALLDSCGNATPEQVRAALKLAEADDNVQKWQAIADSVGGRGDKLHALKSCEIWMARADAALDEYRAAVAQKGGDGSSPDAVG